MPVPGEPQMLLTTNIDPNAHEIGDEIWHTTLRDAIPAEAENTAHHFPPAVIRHLGHPRLVHLIAEDMAAALRAIGDTYTTTDGLIYTLTKPSTDPATAGYPAHMSARPVAVEATFEQTPSYGSRTAIVRWSDGTNSEPLRWYPDEILS